MKRIILTLTACLALAASAQAQLNPPLSAARLVPGTTATAIDAKNVTNIPASAVTLTNYLPKTGGTMSGDLLFSDTVWEDLTLSSLQFRDPPGGEAAPALVIYANGGVTNYVSDFDTGERAFGILQMSHAYASGTECRPHIHWSSSASVTSTWELGINYGEIGQGMTNSYKSVITVTNLVAHKHNMSNFAPMTNMAGKMAESGIFLVAIKCIASGDDTQDLILYDFDIHYQIDKIGSDEENPYE